MTKRFLCCIFPLFLCHYVVLSQSATIAITSSTIAIENNVTTSFAGNSCLLGVAPHVKVRTASTVLTDASTGKTIPVSKVKVFVTQLGTTLSVNLGGTNQEVSLSTTDQTLYTTTLSLSLSSQNVGVRYRIIQSDMTGSAWEAGTYTVSVIYTIGATLCTDTQFTGTLTVTVSPFMTISATSDIALQASTLANFRSTTPTATNSVTINSTVPYVLNAKGATTNFVYNPIAANSSVTPNAPISKLAIQPQGLAGSSNINLQTTYQALSGTINPPVGNATTITLLHQITYGDLATYFAAAGDYTVLTTYQITDTRSSPLSPQTVSFNVKETTADLQELLVNNANVVLSFNNISDYKNGISVDMPSHISVSKTTPLDVYVKASSATLSGASTIPANIITIKGTASQAGITPIQLTSTAQKIYSSATPIVNTSLSIQYGISAANAPQVFNKPQGDYITTITYSFIAP